jgi:hypothetical protein
VSGGLVGALENLFGTALAVAALIVGRRLEHRYAWLLDDDDHPRHDKEDDDATGP